MSDYELNPCKCGSKKNPHLDSDDMVPTWAVTCYDCGQYQHGENWTLRGAITTWNKENIPLAESRDKQINKVLEVK